jgi:nicotinamidase-related amidase
MKTDMYCYLEDRDKKVLPESQAFERWLDPKHTAVVCIDMHRGHIGEDEELTCPAPRARARIEHPKWLDLIVEHDPDVDYYVRTKKRLSAFFPTDLEFLLRKLDVDNIVISGTMTDACDLSTAFAAADMDFRVTIPRDIVAGYSEESEHAALMVLSLHIGIVVDSPALLREWYAREGAKLPDAIEGAATMEDAVGARLAAA